MPFPAAAGFPPQPAPAPVKPVSAPAAPKTQRKPVQLTLNGEPLSLPGKEDRTPYYLMDLLDFSGIDFEHLDRGVELKVNGTECAFTQELRAQDDVVIRYMDM